MDDEEKKDDFKSVEKMTKDFVCIDTFHQVYISIVDIVGYALQAAGRKFHWNFCLSGGSCLISKDFDTKEEAIAWLKKPLSG